MTLYRMARLTRNKQTIKQTIFNFSQFLLDVQSTLTLCTHYYKHYGVKSNSYCYETFSEQRITLRAFFGTRMISFLMGLLLRMPPRKEKGEHSVFSGHSQNSLPFSHTRFHPKLLFSLYEEERVITLNNIANADKTILIWTL